MDYAVSKLTSGSYWLKTGHRTRYPKLEQDIDVDVAVVGAGIAGILTAYHLVQEGKKVALFERFRIINGTTGNTTAKLSAQHGLIYQDLIKRYGKDRAGAYYKANMDGIEAIKRIDRQLGLGSLVENETVYAYTTDPAKVPSFKREIEAYRELGIRGEYLEETPLHWKIEAAVSMQDQGILHPVEFLNGVVEAAVKKGLNVYEETLVEGLERKGDGYMLGTPDGRKISCGHVVYGTHYPGWEKDDYYDRLHARTTQALAYETKEKLFEGAHIAYDTPSVTLRTMEYFGKHYFLIGGQSHMTGDGFSDEERYERIEELAHKLFGVSGPAFKWSTHDLMTEDHMPFMGRLYPDLPNVYTITGLNAWGLANSSAGAIMITDLIMGRSNPYVEMYDPFRKIQPLKKDKEKERSSSTVSKVEQASVENLGPDRQTVIERDGKRIGVYKDPQGKVHYMDLACTHMGCPLGLNDGDGTWDCPCHGSRFDKYGKVIYGPAMTDLKKVDPS